MTIVFIAVPTVGVATNGRLNDEFMQDVAKLHEQYPNITFIAPMIQDYAILPHLKVSATWEVWGKHCERLIEVCDEVWVMQYKGYDTSVGVAGEIAKAKQCGKPVIYQQVPV